MKKIILLLLFSAILFACKNSEEKNVETEGIPMETTEKTQAYKGEFLESNGAMVFMGANFIYGVKRDAMSETLSQKVAPIKNNEQDMVGVIIRGVVSKNTEPGTQWEEMITVTEIMRVDDKPAEADIKFEETKKNN